jgi:glycine betaine/choline ABC-type transport system substrate-binding protein
VSSHTLSSRRPVTGRWWAVLTAATLALAGCATPTAPPELVVGSGTDAESAVLAHVYASALRSTGAAAHVESASDPLTNLDSGAFSVVPGFTGRLLRRFEPGATAVSDEGVYRAMVAALPEGVAAGDYATSGQDKPALAVTEGTAASWGGHDLAALSRHCGQLAVGAIAGRSGPLVLGGCRLPVVREFADKTALFDGLRSGQVNAVWTTTADPGVPADLTMLADPKPTLVQAENVVPLYRRNELTEPQVLAIDQVAGVLDTTGLADLRRQVAGGADPGSVADAWLAAHPLGR